MSDNLWLCMICHYPFLRIARPCCLFPPLGKKYENTWGNKYQFEESDGQNFGSENWAWKAYVLTKPASTCAWEKNCNNFMVQWHCSMSFDHLLWPSNFSSLLFFLSLFLRIPKLVGKPCGPDINRTQVLLTKCHRNRTKSIITNWSTNKLELWLLPWPLLLVRNMPMLYRASTKSSPCCLRLAIWMLIVQSWPILRLIRQI